MRLRSEGTREVNECGRKVKGSKLPEEKAIVGLRGDLKSNKKNAQYNDFSRKAPFREINLKQLLVIKILERVKYLPCISPLQCWKGHSDMQMHRCKMWKNSQIGTDTHKAIAYLRNSRRHICFGELESLFFLFLIDHFWLWLTFKKLLVQQQICTLDNNDLTALCSHR